MGVKNFLRNRSGLRNKNDQVTSAAQLTLRQSLWPLTIVTLLFFLWVSMGPDYYGEEETWLTVAPRSRVLRTACWIR